MLAETLARGLDSKKGDEMECGLALVCLVFLALLFMLLGARLWGREFSQEACASNKHAKHVERLETLCVDGKITYTHNRCKNCGQEWIEPSLLAFGTTYCYETRFIKKE